MGNHADFPTTISQEALDNYSNAVWRLRNLYFIRSESGDKVRFIPNWVQEDFLLEMWFFNLILKARQLGMSTFIDIFLLDVCVWNPNVSAAIIADTEDKAKGIFENIVRFAYENLPDWIQNGRLVEEDNQRSITFDNGSSITVGVSIRGLTFQYLHISELGRIARFSPVKAEEIRSGAINTIHAGQMLFIESTAQGMEGLFYELCDMAMKAKAERQALSPLSFKFHFYPWYLDARYCLADEYAQHVVIPKDKVEYFADLEQTAGIELTQGQRAWYVEKERVQGELMKQEYPSTPQEAFEVSLEGKIFAREMAKVRGEGRILARIPVIPNVPVNTFWDLGHGDYTSIWFHQRVGPENRIIRYYENSGYGFPHYLNFIRSHGYVLGKFYLPHDGGHKRMTDAETGESAEDHLIKLGVAPRDIVIVSRVENKWNDGVEMSRTFLATCVFDKENTADGIKRLDNYKKIWNQQLGAWRNEPAHDENSHGADAFETGARSDAWTHRAPTTTAPKRRGGRARSFRTA